MRNVELPSHGDRQCRARSCSQGHPGPGGLCPTGAILLLPAIMEIPAVLWYRAEADAGGRGRSLWQSLELLWRKSLHPKELEDGVCYFRAAQGEALQSSTLPFCHLHSRFVWEVLLCSECKQRAALQGWSHAVFGCYNGIWCSGTCSPGLGSHVQPTVCHMEPTWRMQEEEEKKFGASAKQMPSAGLQEAVWPGNCSWLNWPSGCACLLWPTSTNCCGALEVPWSSVTGAVSSALQLCGEDLKPHSS